MGISTSNPDLMRTILAMDAYNRGYNAGIKSASAGPNEGLTGTALGLATLGRGTNALIEPNAVTASFFAQAYSFGTGAEVGAALRGKTIISYRGTELANPTLLASWVADVGVVGGAQVWRKPS